MIVQFINLLYCRFINIKKRLKNLFFHKRRELNWNQVFQTTVFFRVQVYFKNLCSTPNASICIRVCLTSNALLGIVSIQHRIHLYGIRYLDWGMRFQGHLKKEEMAIRSNPKQDIVLQSESLQDASLSGARLRLKTLFGRKNRNVWGISKLPYFFIKPDGSRIHQPINKTRKMIETVPPFIVTIFHAVWSTPVINTIFAV